MNLEDKVKLLSDDYMWELEHIVKTVRQKTALKAIKLDLENYRRIEKYRDAQFQFIEASRKTINELQGDESDRMVLDIIKMHNLLKGVNLDKLTPVEKGVIERWLERSKMLMSEYFED